MSLVASVLRPAQDGTVVASPEPYRGVVDGMVNPRSFVAQLPGVLAEDDFCVRMCEAFDAVIAPVYSVLDCLGAYLEPAVAPPDFADWLGGWVGVEADENWSLERRRQLFARSTELYAQRGTVEGLRAHVELYCGVLPEVSDSGGCSWSQTAGSTLPGSGDAHVTVRLRLPDPGSINARTLDGIVEVCRPAHVPATVAILSGTGEVMSSVELGDSPDEATPAAGDGPTAVELPGSEHIEMDAPGPLEYDADSEADADTSVESNTSVDGDSDTSVDGDADTSVDGDADTSVEIRSDGPEDGSGGELPE